MADEGCSPLPVAAKEWPEDGWGVEGGRLPEGGEVWKERVPERPACSDPIILIDAHQMAITAHAPFILIDAHRR